MPPCAGGGGSVVVLTPESVEQIRCKALAAAADALDATRGRSWRNTYVRATLVSYGASCKVFTAVHRHTNRAAAIKVIVKVCRSHSVRTGRERGWRGGEGPAACVWYELPCPVAPLGG